MITSIKFRSGPTPQSLGLTVELAPITVFVGPNNSGKSQVLVELERCSTGAPGDKIIEEVNFSMLTREDVITDLIKFGGADANFFELSEHPPITPGLYQPVSLRLHLPSGIDVSFQQALDDATSPSPGMRSSYGYMRKIYTSRLNGQDRLALLNDKELGNLRGPKNDNMLAQLFRDNTLRTQVRKIVYEALDKYFVIDPTDSGKLQVRLSERAPLSEAEEKGLTDEALNFHNAALSIHQTSDGVRAFVGIIASLVAGDPKIILIDEPEAFLHPALAMKLGKEVSRSVVNTKRLFVSTHSSAFLMGCIQSGVPVNIIRLTYNGQVGSTRVLQQDKLLHLMRNPLLRSTGVLEGLFYEAVIVTEASSDRVFYQEINERLRTDNDSRGISNCLFINAQNKQTVWDIVELL